MIITQTTAKNVICEVTVTFDHHVLSIPSDTEPISTR